MLNHRPPTLSFLMIFDTISPLQIPICCSIFVFKLYHKTCEQFYRNFGLYEKSPNSFLPGLPRSIINQFRFHNFLCLCLASVHLPHPFHLVFGFQLLGHAVLLCQLRHDQLHAVSCRFVNLSAILSYVHPAITLVLITAAASTCFCGSFLLRNTDLSGTCIARTKSAHVFFAVNSTFQQFCMYTNPYCSNSVKFVTKC